MTARFIVRINIHSKKASDHTIRGDKMEEITASIDSHWQEFLVLLQKVMQVPSVKGKPAHHAPYGTEPRRVLDLVLAEAAAKGFKQRRIVPTIGYVQWGENSEEYIGIMVTLMLCLQEQVGIFHHLI